MHAKYTLFLFGRVLWIYNTQYVQICVYNTQCFNPSKKLHKLETLCKTTFYKDETTTNVLYKCKKIKYTGFVRHRLRPE
jgi:hypothetical protein